MLPSNKRCTCEQCKNTTAFNRGNTVLSKCSSSYTFEGVIIITSVFAIIIYQYRVDLWAFFLFFTQWVRQNVRREHVLTPEQCTGSSVPLVVGGITALVQVPRARRQQRVILCTFVWSASELWYVLWRFQWVILSIMRGGSVLKTEFWSRNARLGIADL